MTFGIFQKGKDGKSKEESAAVPHWRIASYAEDHEGKKFKRARKVYSVWGAMKYVMILSILLWWLPMFGQMIAGYVGGRKAGSPWKGLLAAILPVIAIFAVITAIDLYATEDLSAGLASSNLLGSYASTIPVIGPYIDFARQYIGQFVATLAGSSPYSMNTYAITLAFAYIGGIVADQSRRELEAAASMGGSRTSVIVAPSAPEESEPRTTKRHVPVHAATRNVEMKAKPEKKGFWAKKKTPQSFDRLVAANASAYTDRDDDVEVEQERHEKHSDHHQKSHAHEHKSKNVPEEVAIVKPHMKIKVRSQEEETPRRKPLTIKPTDPRTMKMAQRRIEREWDPQRRNRAPSAAVPEAPKVRYQRKLAQQRTWDSM